MPGPWCGGSNGCGGSGGRGADGWGAQPRRHHGWSRVSGVLHGWQGGAAATAAASPILEGSALRAPWLGRPAAVASLRWQDVRWAIWPASWQRRDHWWSTARRSASRLGGGVAPAGRRGRPARRLASRLGGGGAGGGGGGRCVAQPRGWAVAIAPLAVGGAWRAVRPRGLAAAALVAVAGGLVGLMALQRAPLAVSRTEPSDTRMAPS